MPGMRRSVRFAALLFAGLALLAFAATQRPDSAASANLEARAFLPQLARDAPVPATPTPTMPATPTSTVSPTPAPTLVPTPTPQPSGVFARGGTWYTSPYTGTIHVVGLVINGLGADIGFVKVTANFYGSSGQLLATNYTFTEVSVVPAGGSSPYHILLLDPPPGIATISVSVTDYDTTPYRPAVTGLQVSVTNIYRSLTGSVHVVGTVKNQSLRTYDYVQPIAAFLDASGNVIRTDYTFSSPDALAPGQQATFDILFLDAPAGMEQRNLMVWVDALE